MPDSCDKSFCDKNYCRHHKDEKRKQRIRYVVAAILTFIIVILLIIFIIWAVLRPAKPRFILHDATIYTLNLSEPNLLTSNIEVTIAARNPMDRVGIYYVELDVHASYLNQQITSPIQLPSTYLGHRDETIWSPILLGNCVPVSPLVASALMDDINECLLLLDIKIQGKLKWKVGSWVSGKYFINVNCPAYITYGEQSRGIVAADGGIKYQFLQSCTVDTVVA